MIPSTEVKERLSQMSLAEKVGQVFVFTWRNAAQAANDLQLHPGGYIRIYSDALTVGRESAEIQEQSQTPLIIAADFERGIGGTVTGAIEVVNAMALGATRDEKAAFEAGRIIGTEALAMGVNMDYAPDLDVNSNPKNPVINTRSFGQDPELVSRMGVAFLRGLQSAGVAACGKHFPGHGNTSTDSHSKLGSVRGTAEQLRATELIPFQAAIAAGVDAIMSAHLLVEAFEPDPIPATLSQRIMTGLLRDELGFQGLAVTDALDMGAIAENFPPEQSIPMALNAGCDQLIMPQDPALATDILLAAVKRGDVSENRLNEAAARVLSLKETRGIFKQRPASPSIAAHLNTARHRQRVAEIANHSITAVANDGAVPLKQPGRVLCLEIGTQQRERSFYLEPRSFADHLATPGLKVTRMHLPGAETTWRKMSAEEWTHKLRDELARADAIILALYAGIQLGSGNIGLGEGLAQLLHEISNYCDATTVAGKAPVILASFGSPYVIKQIPHANAVFCAFSETQASQAAMARALRGEIPAQGTLPVTLD